MLVLCAVLLLFVSETLTAAPPVQAARKLHQDEAASVVDLAAANVSLSDPTAALQPAADHATTNEPAAAVATVDATTIVNASAKAERRRRRRRAATAAATCGWPGHCAGDPCTTYNDCDGTMTCISGKCGTSGSTPTPTPPPTTTCGWPGHCLGDPCTTYNDCDGALTCVSGKCGTSGSTPPPTTNLCSGKVCTCTKECRQPGTCNTLTGVCSACTTKPNGATCSIGTCQRGVCTCTTTPPTTRAPGQGQCPNGWYEAKLTVYDSWPYPNSNEWQYFSGGQYLGTFAYKYTSAACNQAGEVHLSSWSTPNGQSGSIPGGCHWRHDWVASNRIASVFKSAASPVNINFNTQIAGKQIRVAPIEQARANPTGAGSMVTVADTCGDGDCSGCCTANANTSPSKVLIDLEKNTLKALFPSISGFVATNIAYSGQRAAYQGSMFDAGSISGYPGTVCFRLP